LEARAAIALKLIEHFAVVAGFPEGEDSAGRAKVRLQTANELVKRAFEIADLFVDLAETRSEIRETTHKEPAEKRSGEIQG
jgi:hypothetical protein